MSGTTDQPARPLDGQAAIVTGGGRGVGRGIALALSSAGARVAIIERSTETFGDTLAEIERRGGTGIAVACDIRHGDEVRDAVAQVVDQFGGLRILVNNAQMITDAPLLDMSEESLDDMWRSGPLAAVRFMRECHPHLRHGGSVVNISSSSASIAGPPGFAGYAAVKAALETFSRAAAVEWGSEGIRVNAIQPRVRTPAFEKWERDHPREAAASIRVIPAGRLADAEADVGRVVVFLSSVDAAMVTGTIVPVDGGTNYVR